MRLVIVLTLLGGLAVLVVSNNNKYTEESNTDPVAAHAAEEVRSADQKDVPCIDGNSEASCEKKLEKPETDESKDSVIKVKAEENEIIHLAVVACGDRAPETTIMIKSALLLTRSPLHIHIFTEDDLKANFTMLFNAWPQKIRDTFRINMYPINFPGVDNAKDWIKLFKPCACQRLFLPYILPDVERLLYVDTDILFLSSLDDVWSFYDEFNSTHIAALAPEHEAPWMGWYNRFARHPYYGPLGVNSGVMLMHLEQMRRNSWIERMKEYFVKYEKRTTWGDQDLINIYFHFFPEKLYVYNCKWNYRPDHCMYGNNCDAAEKDGIKILHGSRRVFHNEKQLAFRAIYEIVEKIEFGADLEKQLLKNITTDVTARAGDTHCGKVVNFYTEELARQIKKLKER